MTRILQPTSNGPHSTRSSISVSYHTFRLVLCSNTYDTVQSVPGIVQMIQQDKPLSLCSLVFTFVEPAVKVVRDLGEVGRDLSARDCFNETRSLGLRHYPAPAAWAMFRRHPAVTDWPIRKLRAPFIIYFCDRVTVVDKEPGLF